MIECEVFCEGLEGSYYELKHDGELSWYGRRVTIVLLEGFLLDFGSEVICLFR